RAIYYNRRLFEEQNLSTPQTLPQLDDAAQRLTLRDANGRLQRVGFLPDSRRLWAWGAVFGSDFLQDDQTRAIATGAMGTDDKTTSRPARVTVDEPSTIAAARWMATYADRYGPRTIAAFRSGDQSLPGKSFPLLANRYAMILDGQWRVRDIANAENPDEYGVMPLPPPPGGRRRAGWLNGNYFIIPRGAAAADGSIAFIKYWIGYTGELSEATEDVEEPDELSPRVAAAADTAVRGGWIPVLPAVANHAVYQRYLDQQPLMRQFIDLAASESQIPYPNQPGTAKLRREIELTGARIMMREVDPETALQQLSEVIHPNGPTLSAGISANEKRQRPAGNH
ncbi:MAG: extracellular solute-binding protein, partial [Planctomycetota bacterium]